jgi:hypothetical protein
VASQQNPVDYVKAIQAQLKTVLGAIPVYSLMNRNYATQPKFATWQLRNVHQPVYTGPIQSVKGIDRPTFQVSLFAQNAADVLSMSNTILQAMHGYTGMFGGPTGIYVTKTDVQWLYNSYDDKLGMNQIFLDITIDIQT